MKFLIKESTAYPFIDSQEIIGNIIENDLKESLELILKEISILEEHLLIAARNHSVEIFFILYKHVKANNLKINYKKLFISYFSFKEETEKDLKIIKELLQYVTKGEVITILSGEFSYYYANQKTRPEYCISFKYLLEKLLTDKKNYHYLNKIFSFQMMNDNSKNVECLFKK